MESPHHPLLLQLGTPCWDPALGQLRWHCPLTQEQAAEIADPLLGQLDCRPGPVQQGADRLFWPVTFEDTALALHFEALCDCLWLQADNNEAQDVLAFLAKLASAEPCHD